jgi:phage pi2 protein 07
MVNNRLEIAFRKKLFEFVAAKSGGFGQLPEKPVEKWSFLAASA